MVKLYKILSNYLNNTLLVSKKVRTCLLVILGIDNTIDFCDIAPLDSGTININNIVAKNLLLRSSTEKAISLPHFYLLISTYH